jgi:hypothetical protein
MGRRIFCVCMEVPVLFTVREEFVEGGQYFRQLAGRPALLKPQCPGLERFETLQHEL